MDVQIMDCTIYSANRKSILLLSGYVQTAMIPIKVHIFFNNSPARFPLGENFIRYF